MTIQRLHVGKRLSQIVIHGNTVYLAGEVPDDGSKDVAGQTEEVLSKIDKLLAQAGTDKGHLLSAQIFLTDIREFAAMNAVWEKWVIEGQTPARATIQAKLGNPAFRVEIMCIAALPGA
ncbi:MAG: RidA family protein [Nevskiaceae bacterium]|jgi:enamine deaminase RidA (YjgF/YER057c/UK114 family)|nr:RidA family protein [Nevskiaceae bacterium]